MLRAHHCVLVMSWAVRWGRIAGDRRQPLSWEAFALGADSELSPGNERPYVSMKGREEFVLAYEAQENVCVCVCVVVRHLIFSSLPPKSQGLSSALLGLGV